jgi:MATE family multidrug resistance protein
MGIAGQSSALAFVLSFGMGLAAAARVGNLLGAGLPGEAKLAAEVATAMSALAMAPVALALALAGGRTAALFTDDRGVRAAFEALAVPMAVAVPGPTLSGVLRGCGRQRAGAAVNAVSNWAVGLTAQWVLAFRLGWGAGGLWWGLAGMALVQAAMLAAVVLSSDWGQERRRAARLLRRMSGRGRGAGGDGNGGGAGPCAAQRGA